MPRLYGMLVTHIASSPSALPSIRLAHPLATPWPVLLTTVALAAAAGSIAIGALSRQPSGFDNHLALLLRFMAALKALTAMGALGLLTWRLRLPIRSATAIGYLAALAVMLVAPGLIWSPDHVAMSALCFHAGLFGVLGLALRDDAVGSRLSGRLSSRGR